VTDAGLVHLKRVPRIMHNLDLTGTGVTDAGLVHLKHLVYLKELSLVETQVTDKGIADLQIALPRAHIIY
jgi:hypothetical protein